MRTRVFTLAGACVCLLVTMPAHAQTSPSPTRWSSTGSHGEKNPWAILEIGAATSWNVTGGATDFRRTLPSKPHRSRTGSSYS